MDTPLGWTILARMSPLARAKAFVPCIRVGTETLVTTGPTFREVRMPVIELGFDYGGGERDAEGERQARYLLESFGAVELACLDDYSAGPESHADYVVRVDDDVHGLCSFSAYALPQLRALGWRVAVAADYPFQVIESEAPWYARVEPESGDWFNLELGIELDGARVNLLPALLELLERLPRSGRIDAIIPGGARCFAVPVGDNRYLPVPPERLRILVGVLRELYDPEARKTVTFSAAQAASLAAMETGAEAVL